MTYPSATDRLAAPVRPDGFRDYRPPQVLRRNYTRRPLVPIGCTDDAERYHPSGQPKMSQAKAEARARMTDMASTAINIDKRKSRRGGSK